MRLKDFEFDTWYATCDGRRGKIVKFPEDGDHPIVRRRFEAIPVFVTRDTVGRTPFTDPDVEPRNWSGDRYAEGYPTKDVYIPEYDVPKVATDPWGKCTTERAKSVAAQENRTMRFIDGYWHYLSLTVYKGIVLDVYTVDPEGEVIDSIEPHRMVYAQKDIPGTWLAYMALHAEDVKERGERAAKQRKADEMRLEAVKRINRIFHVKMAETPASAPSLWDYRVKQSKVSMHYTAEPPTRGSSSMDEPDTYRLTVTLEGAAALAYARNTLRLPGLKNATVTARGNIKLP